MKYKSICFVGLDNYPVLNPEKGDEYFGGESVQQTLLAKAFRDIGYDVSMIVGDYGQPREEVREGIRVINTFAENEGIPVFRYIYPRMTSVWAALKKANAAIYFQSCAGVRTGITARFCCRHSRTFVFRLAHDSDCIPGEQLIPYWRDKKVYEYGLKRAHFISAQGMKQVELLKHNYGLNSTPVNMAVESPTEAISVKKDIDILWVNNYRDFKRPELVLQIARSLPEFHVVMIGGAVPGNERLYEEIGRVAKNLVNLDILGPISYHHINDYFSRAKIFVNTSDWEGFPNSFLQAWIRRVPVLSFFDPDGLIKENELGAVPSNIDDMSLICRDLLTNVQRTKEIGIRTEKFARENYSPVAVARSYEAFLNVH